MKQVNIRRGYLLVFGLLIIISFCLFYSYAYPAYEESRIREKAWDRQQEVNLLSGIADLLVEHGGTAGGITYEDVLRYSIRYIETEFTSTFAQLYDESLTPLMELSPGVSGGQKHDPLAYPEFVEAVTTHEFGSLTYWYETPQAGGRDVYMTYRWVPTDTSHSNRYLIAVAISKFSISESLAESIRIWTIGLIIIASIYIMLAAFYICITKKEKETEGESLPPN